MRNQISIYKALLFLSFYSNVVFCQSNENTPKPLSYFASGVSVTHNGLSVIPSFSLGKPAAIFDLNLRKKKLSFEPQLRFALEGKPWSFLFWWRYKVLKTNHFALNIGAHPALLFKTIPVTSNGITKETITAQRYLATELSPNYLIHKNVSVGVYYLFSHGIEKDATRYTHFLTLNANFSNIKLTNGFFMKFSPQVFYLKMDKKDGFYATSTLTLAKKDFPLSLTFVGNQKIKSTIAGKDFVWNFSLNYFISKKYTEQ